MKIAIIGAGINGLYLAWKLSEKGHKVTVFEKKEKIGKLACSGLFSERILDFIPQSRKLIQNRISSVLIHFPKRTLKVEFSRQFLIMSHFDLDNLVADLAREAGAKIVLNNTVNSIPDDFDRVIGCDGCDSFIRKSLGLVKPSYRLGLLWSELEENFSDCLEVWPTKNGFSWKIPRGQETEYGIIDKPQEIKIDLQNKKVKSALIPEGFSIPHNKFITLCGDAAGLTKPWSGGGVVWGLMAADILLKNFPDFLKYKNRAIRFFLPRIVFSKIMTKMVYFFGSNFPYFLPQKVKIESDFLI